MRYIIARNLLFCLVENLLSLVDLSFVEEAVGQLRHQTTMSITHSHHCFIEIDAGLVDTTELILVHDVVEGLLGIEVLYTWYRLTVNIGGEWSDTVGETLLDEVVTEVHVIVGTNGGSNIYRTSPVALIDHLEHHQVALIESTLALQRDNHPVGDRVAGHEHTALTYCLLVDGDIYGVGRNDV